MRKYSQTILTIIMLGLVIATGTLLVSVWFFPPPEEPTPVLGLLNENRMAGPYPTNVTLYQNITLIAQIQNRMGIVQYFYLRIKLATPNELASNTQPSPAVVLWQYERILANFEWWEVSLQLNMTIPGINLRLTFEIWRYDPSSDNIVYTGIWNHIPMNITS